MVSFKSFLHMYDCSSCLFMARTCKFGGVRFSVLHVVDFLLRHLKIVISHSSSSRCLRDVQQKRLSASCFHMCCFSGTLQNKLGGSW